MSNHWAPSGLISRDFECKKSVSLCVILVQMPLSNFTLHLPYSPDGGAPAGVKWGRASLTSIHLMRRRRKSRDRRRAATDGQQLPKKKKKNEYVAKQTHKSAVLQLLPWQDPVAESFIHPFPVPASPALRKSTQEGPRLVAMRRITTNWISFTVIYFPPLILPLEKCFTHLNSISSLSSEYTTHLWDACYFFDH